MGSFESKCFQEEIAELPVGGQVYMNVINFSESSVYLLRKFIHDGVLTPDEEELQKCIVPEALAKYRGGECLVPQMTYTKTKTIKEVY